MQHISYADEEEGVPDVSSIVVDQQQHFAHPLSSYHQQLQKQQHEQQSPHHLLRPPLVGQPTGSSSISSSGGTSSAFSSSIEEYSRSSPLSGDEQGGELHDEKQQQQQDKRGGGGSLSSHVMTSPPSATKPPLPPSSALGTSTTSMATTVAQPAADTGAAKSHDLVAPQPRRLSPTQHHQQQQYGRNGTLLANPARKSGDASNGTRGGSNDDGIDDDNARASTSKAPLNMSIPLAGLAGPSFDALTTPEAQWNSSRATAAPGGSSLAEPLPLLSDASLGDHGLFETTSRPYTPSYNSISSFSDAFSDHEEFIRSVASQIGGDELDIGSLGGDGGGAEKDSGPTFAYDPDTADSYHPLDSSLLSLSFLGSGAGSSISRKQTLRHSVDDAQETLVPPRQAQPLLSSGEASGSLVTPTAFEDTDRQLRASSTSPSAAASSSASLDSSSPAAAVAAQQRGDAEAQPDSSSAALHPAEPHFGAQGKEPDYDTDLALKQMQVLGQRMTLQDPVAIQNPMLGISSSTYAPQQQQQDPRNLHSSQLEGQSQGEPQLSQSFYQHHDQQQQQQHDASEQQPLFAPVFEDEPAELDLSSTAATQAQQSATFPAYTYLQPTSLDASFPDLSVFAPAPPQPQRDDTMRATDYGAQAQAGVSGHHDGTRGESWQSANGGTSDHQGNVTSRSAWDYGASGADGYGGQAQQGHSLANPFAVPPTHHLHNSFDTQTQSQGHHQAGEDDHKRQDSLERVRRFLRLDVDMGFAASQDGTSDVAMPQRKRSNSDVGPAQKEEGAGETASPTPFGNAQAAGATDRTPVAATSNVDWANEAAKQRRSQQSQQGFGGVGADASNGASHAMHDSTMDPHFLQQQQIEQQAIQRMQQQAQGLQHQPQDPASGPMRSRENSSNRGQGPYFHARTGSSSSMTPFEQMPATLARTSSTRSRRSHSRYPQSDDYNSLTRFTQGHDGNMMAPPAQMFGAGGLLRNGIGRMDMNLDALQRPPSAPHAGMVHSDMGMPSAWARYNGMRSSASSSSSNQGVPLTQQTYYSQTSTPTYSALHNVPGHAMTAGTTKYEVDGTPAGTFPIVAQVTTSATQAASASRRKNEAIHVCPIPGCGSTFTRKFNLNGHIRSHTGSRPYQCKAPGCGKSFARSFDLSRHEKLHAGIKPHTCETCGKAFARADALSRHLRHDAGSGGCATRFGEDEGDENLSAGTPGDGVKTMLPTLSEVDDDATNEFANGRPSSQHGSYAMPQHLSSHDEHHRQQQQQHNIPPPPPAPAPGQEANGGFTPLWQAPVRRDARFRGQVL